MDDIAEKLYDVIGGRVGYYDIPKTMIEAAAEIKRLQDLNSKSAKVIAVATSALGALSIATYPGSDIASKALEQMEDMANR